MNEELAKLAMTFRVRSGQKGKQVLSDTYHAGREAGDRFECRSGIEHAG